MPEVIPLRMARAYPEQIQRVREWFQKLDELIYDESKSPADLGLWLNLHYGEVENDWERILFGYETMIDNACDQSLSYLEFKPEIKAAIALANGGAGELVRAVDKLMNEIYEFDKPVSQEYIEAVENALARLRPENTSSQPANPEGDPSKPATDPYSA